MRIKETDTVRHN